MAGGKNFLSLPELVSEKARAPLLDAFKKAITTDQTQWMDAPFLAFSEPNPHLSPKVALEDYVQLEIIPIVFKHQKCILIKCRIQTEEKLKE